MLNNGTPYVETDGMVSLFNTEHKLIVTFKQQMAYILKCLAAATHNFKWVKIMQI